MGASSCAKGERHTSSARHDTHPGVIWGLGAGHRLGIDEIVREGRGGVGGRVDRLSGLFFVEVYAFPFTFRTASRTFAWGRFSLPGWSAPTGSADDPSS